VRGIQVEGPIATEMSLPYGSVWRNGDEQSHLLQQFDYLEEEFFVSGEANVYGPSQSYVGGSTTLNLDSVPLTTLCRRGVPYKTRTLVIRPRNANRFSGITHVVPFHNLIAQASVDPHLLRHGDAWVGVEVCSGTRFGPDEIPSGGIANLHKVDPERYGELTIRGGEPSDWDKLTPGALGKAFKTLNFGQQSPELEIFLQELNRSYAQGPDIFFDVVEGLRLGSGSVLPGLKVRRVYSSAASGGTQILRPLAQFHHNRRLMPDGSPPIDGYLFMVGQWPSEHPSQAVVTVFMSEAEAAGRPGEELPEDTDDPRFRYYELPGTGHRISASPAAKQDLAGLGRVLPPGIQGLNAREASAEYKPYDKVNTPILWALWHNMYRWVDEELPMPRDYRITRVPAAPDGLGRDGHGNALGGIRTPWVDVPDARYVPRISSGDPLSPGMKPFSEEQMKSLYGTREEYERRVKAKLNLMIQEGWLLPEDASLMIHRQGD
jgi:hypothetical protein